MIGLTGGIASGKTLVKEHLESLGAVVLDADLIAREVVAPGTPALEEIAQTFGESVLHTDGSLNREALGAIIFGDDDARAKLNLITHPRIGQTMLERTEEASASGIPWIVYDAALIVENGLHHGLAGLVVVACDERAQRERLMARDELTVEAAQQRIDAQLPLADKVAVADWIVDNSGTREETRLQVQQLFDTLTQTFGAIDPHGEE